MSAPEPLTLRADHEDAMRMFGRALAEAALPLPADGFLVDLRGELGMGKTVFVRGVAAGLGVPGHIPVVSPTFTIARSYAGTRAVLHHIDAYRLRGAEDLEAAGFEEMCGEGALTCVEWGSRVADALPADRMEVTLEMHPDAEQAARVEPGGVPVFPRRVDLRPTGPHAEAILARLRRRFAVGESA